MTEFGDASPGKRWSVRRERGKRLTPPGLRAGPRRPGTEGGPLAEKMMIGRGGCNAML